MVKKIRGKERKDVIEEKILLKDFFIKILIAVKQEFLIRQIDEFCYTKIRKVQ